MKIYVGNLPFSFSDQDLENLFSPHGTVKSAKVIMDRESGRSKGFGFVELASREEGMKAIKALDGFTPPSGKPIVVNEARPKNDDKRESRGGSPFKKGGFGRG